MKLKEKPWEDPIVADVRKAREKLFAGAGCDLDELCKQLRERQQREGRAAVSHPSRQPVRRAGTAAKKRRGASDSQTRLG